TEALDRVGEVEVNAAPLTVDHRADAEAVVADGHGVTARDVARHKGPKRGIALLEVIITTRPGDRARILIAVFLLPRDPNASIVSERFAHERKLRLIGAALRDAGRVDLSEAGVGEGRSLAVGPPDGGRVGALGVGREIKNVSVAAGCEDDD